MENGGQPVRQVAAPRVRGSTRVQNGGCVSDLFLFDSEEVLIDQLEHVHQRQVRQLQNRRTERHDTEVLDVQLNRALTLNGHTRSPEAQVRLAVPDDDQEGDLNGLGGGFLDREHTGGGGRVGGAVVQLKVAAVELVHVEGHVVDRGLGDD